MARVEVLHMTKANMKIVLKVLFQGLVWILKALTKLKQKVSNEQNTIKMTENEPQQQVRLEKTD